ncbi:MAG: ABC transporter ATP-binding protein [bacterium]
MTSPAYSQCCSSFLFTWCATPLTITVLLFVLFYIHWKFALLALLFLPFTGIVLSVLGKKMQTAGSRSQTIVGEISHHFQESLQGMTVVKAFNYEKGAINKFGLKNNELFSQMMKYLRATALSGPLMEFGGSIILTLMVYYAGVEIFAGRLTPGKFFSFLAAFFAAYGPLKNIANSNSTFQMGMASWERILQLLEEKPSMKLPSSPRPVARLEGRVALKNVRYSYPSGARPALDGLELEIKPGEVVAFVGPSGSGKTTLVHLLLRLFDPLSGVVLYDGTDLRELDIRQLRDHVGLVTQETVLFDDTVSGNISLGRPQATKEDVLEAARAADAHDFISGLAHGYDTPLGERGVKLSGGQRQRLAIARALLKKPSVLILDEATSNLDTASEKYVQQALEKVLAGRTVIMVAHRLSTVRNSDRIFVLDRGRVVESGKHIDLIKTAGVYQRLHDMQSGTGDEEPEQNLVR